MTYSSKSLVVTHIVSGDLWAGAEVQVFNLCRSLQASAAVFPTAVVFNSGILHDKLQELGIPVTLADEKHKGPHAIARLIAAHCKEHGSRIVHTHGFKENVLGILGKEFAGVPLSVRTVHGNPETALSMRRPHKWLISQVDILLGKLRQQAVIAVSTQLEETLKAIFPGKVHKIFNFVDVDDLRSQWAPETSPGKTMPRIGIVGRLVPVKRVDIFIRTIALLNERGIACTGVIIGSGPLEDELRQLAIQLGIADQIEFKGFLNPAIKELRKLDALLMTSDHEGLPMTLLEAMALQVPIIAHRVGGIPEVLDWGKCGWLVEEHSEQGYAYQVSRLLDSDSTEKLEAGLRHVQRTFGRTTNTDLYIKLYQNV